MIFFACSGECDFVGRVHVEDEAEAAHLIGPSSEWYPNKYPCPKCGSSCTFSARSDPMSRFTDLTTKEAFIAFSGVGLPEEQECGASVVRNLILEQGVKDVTTRHIANTKRCLLERITLNDGTELYLGASSLGACVYRIKKASSYVE